MMIGMQEIIADAAGIVMSVIGIAMTGINIVMSERDIVVANGRERGYTAHGVAVQPEALVGATAEAVAVAVAKTAAAAEAEVVVVMWMSSGHPEACQTDQRLLLMKATGTGGLHEHDLLMMSVFS
jgi:hypothetical protein